MIIKTIILISSFFYTNFLAGAAPPSLTWNTYETIETDFCDHLYYPNSKEYNIFFENIVNVIHPLLDPLEDLQYIENIIIATPEVIRCDPHFVHIVTETNEDTPILRRKLKELAIKVKQECGKAVALILKVKPKNDIFPIWNSNKGLYVLCRDRSQSMDTVTANDNDNSRHNLEKDELDIINNLAHRRRVQVNRVWIKYDGEGNKIIHISIQAYGSTKNLQNFQKELEQRLRKQIQIVL